MVKIYIVSVCGPKMTWFCVGIGIDLIFVWEDEIGLMSACKIDIDLISVKG